MSRLRELAALLILAGAPALGASEPNLARPGLSFDLGRLALPEEIAAWDSDVRPDGTGLPRGSGDVSTGEKIFSENCAGCHGDFGEGVGRRPALAGGGGTLQDERPLKTVGSYWPYLSTLWDFIHRAKPFGASGSLSVDEVYALTAYILYLNYLVEDDFTLSDVNFTDIRLPNQDAFFDDDRNAVEYELFSAAPCMVACKEDVRITKSATAFDVTPDEGAAE